MGAAVELQIDHLSAPVASLLQVNFTTLLQWYKRMFALMQQLNHYWINRVFITLYRGLLVYKYGLSPVYAGLMPDLSALIYGDAI